MAIYSREKFQFALNSSFPHAYWLAGRAFASGIGAERDTAEAQRLFERGIALGSPLCRRDLALLLLDSESDSTERQRQIRMLADSATEGCANLPALVVLMSDSRREHRGLAVRWLQHKLVFEADWHAGFALYLSLLFPLGSVPVDKELLHEALVELSAEKAQARKALAFGLLSGALTGRCHGSQAIRLLEKGSTPNEIALSALVNMEHSGSKNPQRFLRAERALYISSQAGSSFANALLIRLTMQQTENSPDPFSREHISRALLEHMSNYPMHANDESLRILVRWFGEDAHLREKFLPRLRKILMRCSEIGMSAAVVALARIALINGDSSAAVDRLRKAALRGHAGAIKILAQPELVNQGALSDTESHFWERLIIKDSVRHKVA